MTLYLFQPLGGAVPGPVSVSELTTRVPSLPPLFLCPITFSLVENSDNCTNGLGECNT